ncbi:hypothetical protein ACFX13_010503 [Malus domestica]|uniref:HMA domain-containing protein n=1 Tax=Malus domestica TaxID=3750 RepID=A0A498IJD5_MALDO|nr:hypothetical protein DVH24_036586 [Malus domestica]
MPTAEAKSQAKPEKTIEIEEVSQPPFKYNIWVLKVRIHCEGCIKEVEKILKKIDGVYRTDSDGKIGKDSKVTVTGNVEPKILIKALAKGGKHAEMWPGSEDGNHGRPGGSGSCGIERETVEAEVVQVQDNGGKKKNESGSGAGRSKGRNGLNAVKVNEGGGAPAKSGGGGKGKEVKVEAVRQGESVNMSEQPAAAQKCFGGDYDEDDSDCEV